MIQALLFSAFAATLFTFGKESSGQTDSSDTPFSTDSYRTFFYTDSELEGQHGIGPPPEDIRTQRTEHQNELIERVLEAMVADEYKQAHKYLDRLIRLEQYDSLYHILRADCYVKSGQRDEAIDSYDKGLDYDGKVFSIADDYRGAVYEQIGLLEQSKNKPARSIRSVIEKMAPASRKRYVEETKEKAKVGEAKRSWLDDFSRKGSVTVEEVRWFNLIRAGWHELATANLRTAAHNFNTALKCKFIPDVTRQFIQGEIDGILDAVPKRSYPKQCQLCNANSELLTVEGHTVCADCFNEWWGKAKHVATVVSEHYRSLVGFDARKNRPFVRKHL